MGLIEIVVISFVAIVLLHLTLKNLLARQPQQLQLQLPQTGAPTNASRDEMLEFVRGHLIDLERGKRSSNPKGSNYYNKFHDSDLHSEITDLSKFFDIQQSVPDTKELLREINGPECGLNTINDCKTVKPSLVDAQFGTPMRFDMGSDGTATFMPDQWSYKNEKPMNGGKVDGVRGFDDAVSDFAVYPAADERKDFTSSYPYQQTFSQF